jgi:hypothetical protein
LAVLLLFWKEPMGWSLSFHQFLVLSCGLSNINNFYYTEVIILANIISLLYFSMLISKRFPAVKRIYYCIYYYMPSLNQAVNAVTESDASILPMTCSVADAWIKSLVSSILLPCRLLYYFWKSLLFKRFCKQNFLYIST